MDFQYTSINNITLSSRALFSWDVMYRWVSLKLQYLQCVSNGDTAIDMFPNNLDEQKVEH